MRVCSRGGRGMGSERSEGCVASSPSSPSGLLWTLPPLGIYHISLSSLRPPSLRPPISPNPPSLRPSRLSRSVVLLCSSDPGHHRPLFTIPTPLFCHPGSAIFIFATHQYILPHHDHGRMDAGQCILSLPGIFYTNLIPWSHILATRYTRIGAIAACCRGVPSSSRSCRG